MSPAKKHPRRAVAGECARCGAPTIRGLADDGLVAETDRLELDAAHELDAYSEGRRTYVRLWRGHMELDRRDPADMIVNPSGYRRDAKVVREHRCWPPVLP